MRLDDLLQPTPNDIILREAILTSKSNQEREYITELLPLIPLALWGAGVAWTAYDAYQAKQAYNRGEITGADLTKMVGTDIAITLAAGGVAKVLGKGWRYGKKIYKSKKAAKEAEKASVTSAAAAVNKTVKSQVADVMPHSQAAVATATSKLDNVVTPAAANIVKVAKKVDDVVDKVSSKAPDVVTKVKNKVGDILPHSGLPVTKATTTVVKKNADNIVAPATAVTTKAVKTAVSKNRPWKRGEVDIKTPSTSTAASSVAGKGTANVVKRNADEIKCKGKNCKNVKCKGKNCPKKGKWGLGGGLGSSMHNSNFSQFVDKYGYNK